LKVWEEKIMAKSKLTLQQHLDNPKYGSRFTLVLRYLSNDYNLDIDEIALNEEVLLIIALSLEQYISPKLIAEQVDTKLKEKEEEEIEPISAPTQSVGMFESDLWEHEMGGPTMGPWELPYAKGGFLNTPRIESPRSSPHYVPGWQKVRTYGQDHPEKTRMEIANDLGFTTGYVSHSLRGTIGRTKDRFARENPNLPQIFVAESPKYTKRRQTTEVLYGVGDKEESEERTDIIKEEIRNVFVERMIQEDEPTQYELVIQLAKDYKLGWRTVRNLLGNLFDRSLAYQESGGRLTDTKLMKAGTSREELEEYLREFGEEHNDREISDTLGISPVTVYTARKKLKINFPKYGIRGQLIGRRPSPFNEEEK
jgi:hypothetical protein